MKYAAVFAVAFIAACVSPPLTGYVVSAGNIKINVEVADSPDELQRGLMFRDSLQADSGMLFVFSDSQVRSFWMKNTLIPLDIIFIDSNDAVVDIQQMEPCTGDPCPRYVSVAPAKYALEVNRGFAAAHGIRVGDRLSIRI